MDSTLRRCLGLPPRSPHPMSSQEVLNRALESTAAGDLMTFHSIVDANTKQVVQAYDDFFAVGAEVTHSEEFLTKLTQLDVQKNDPWMASVHMTHLRNFHSRGCDLGAEIPVLVICQHYGRDHLQSFLDRYGTLVNGQDPDFRSDTPNFLISVMRHVDQGCLEEDFALKILNIFVEHGANVDARYKSDDGMSAVHFAAKTDLWMCVEFLMRSKANIDFPHQGVTAREIIMASHAYLLIDANSPNPNKNGNLAFFDLLYNDMEEEFVQLYEREKLGNYLKDDGWNTLLQLAARKNHVRAVKKILQDEILGAHVVSGLKDSPILLAAERGHLEIVLNLASYKIDEHGGRQIGAARVEEKGDHGDTILHKIARWWSAAELGGGGGETERAVELIVEIIEIFSLRDELDINASNKKGETPFQLFLAKSNRNLFNFLLNKGAFLGIDKNLMSAIHTHDLQNMFDTKISTIITTNGYKVVNMDFECFEINFRGKQKILQGQLVSSPEMLTLYKLSKSPKHAILLSHPLIKSFLDLKWLKIYWIYFINLLIYLSFMASLTTYMCYTNAPSPQHSPISGTITIVFWMILVLREFLQTVMAPVQYFRMAESWLQMIILILTPLVMIAPCKILSTLLILTTYSEFSLLLGRHPGIASYISMFLKVFKVNIILLAISAPIMYAFAISFFILFSTSESHSLFNTPITSMFKTIIMSTGEFDASDLEFDLAPFVSKIIFITFVIVIEIILMNLLHALAVHDTEGIQRDAEIFSIQAKIELYAKIESAWFGFPMNWYEDKWGTSSGSSKLYKFWLSCMGDSFKSLVHISVLPFPQTNKFKISIREDGKILDITSKHGRDVTHTEENYLKYFFSNSTIFRPVIKMITGVDMQEMFSYGYEYVMNKLKLETDDELAMEIKNVKSEVEAMREQLEYLKSLLTQHFSSAQST